MLSSIAVKNAGKLALSLIIGLSLFGSLPATVQAETDPVPVDLVLGGEGDTPWNITNIQPGDGGTKTIELHNAGSEAGFVTIWISDIVSSEGMNPEAETGNTAEPGELTDHLILGLAADNISTNLNLPTTIGNLPHSVSDAHYIDLIPLKTGDTVDLQWQWELPAQTNNDVQGDGVSFTINYLLQEFEITDVSGVVDEETGAFTEEVTVESEFGNGKVTIEEGTVGKTKDGEPVSEIWLIEMYKEPSAPSEDTATVGVHYELGPHGTTFDRPVTITFAYYHNEIPERASEWDLVIVLWDKGVGEWVELEGSTVDTVNNVILAPVSHFGSRYTLLAHVPPPSPPLPPPPSLPTPPPTPAPAPAPTVSVLEIDMQGKTYRIEIESDGTLRESLTLADPSGNFVIDIDSGTRVTGADNMELSGIDLVITEEPIVVPDDIVVLSPIYKVTGYTRNMEISRINFNPFARLTIVYRPGDLPENTFPPFVGRYTDEEGLVRLEPPPGATVEIGKAKAELSHASLFAVMAQLAPPPPPLPAKFEVSNLTINPRQARPGQPVIISLTIANDGETIGSYELYLIMDGIVRAVREITLTGKSIETVSFEVSNLAAGKHRVKIAGLTGEFRIISTAALPPESQIDWLTIDLSVVAVVVAGLLVLYLVIRRSRQPQRED